MKENQTAAHALSLFNMLEGEITYRLVRQLVADSGFIAQRSASRHTKAERSTFAERIGGKHFQMSPFLDHMVK